MSVVSVSVTFTNGKGSLTHNNREFSASNVRQEFTKNNVVLKRQDLNEAYEEIFNESCEVNNERQKRADRKLSPDQYLKKIENGCGKKNNPKPFYESIVQVGNMYDTGIINNPEQAEQAKEVLKEYFQEFEKNNPNIRVFNATIHMDEQTPHMHIDWVPVAGGYKTGMPERNSLEKALEQQGVKADGKTDRRNNNRAVWQEREANRLIEVCKRHGIEASFNRHEKAEETLSINDFKKISKIAERKANALSKEIEKMSYFEFIRNGKEKVFCIMEKHLELNEMHIFPDRNKCTGRALIIWSCLQHDLTPIVIEKEQRYEYIRALEEKNTEKLYRIAEKSQQIEREKREELVKNLEKDHFPEEKEGENQEIDKNMLKTLYNELEEIHNTFPQNEELEAEKVEIQSSITVIKSKDEYERVKEDIRQYERDCLIHRRNLKKIREREAREQGFERYIKRC